MPLTSAQQRSRAELAADWLGEISAEVSPGWRLGTKEELRRRAGVSVGTFNEALRLAQAKGIVDVRPGPGGGLFAAAQSPMVRLGNVVLALDADQSSVGQAIRMRDAIDPLLVEDAIQYAKPADIKRLWKHVQAIEAAGDDDLLGSTRAIWRLHVAICDISPNDLITSIYKTLLALIETHTVSALPDVQHPGSEAMRTRRVIHRDIVQAIADGDTARAAELMDEHRTTPTLARLVKPAR